MFTNRSSIEIVRPLDEVFAYVDDVTRFPEWVDGVVECSGPRGAPPLSRFEVVIREGKGRTIRLDGERMQRDSDRRISFRMWDAMFEIRLSFALEPTAGGVRVDLQQETTIKNSFARLFTPLLRWRNQKKIHGDLLRLQLRLEADEIVE